MHSIEVSDTDHGRLIRRRLGQRVDNLHQVECSIRTTRIIDGMAETGQKFEKLVGIMAALRGPNGCPWDKEQDFDTLKPMLVEEVYEVIEAIDERNYPGLAEELGDVLLHVVFQAQLAREESRFDIDTVIQAICDKLVRRHPHVFGNEPVSSSAEVIKNWEIIKAQEGKDRRSLLEGVPGKLPAIHEAHQISARAARSGFDWQDVSGIFDKLQEEIDELRDVLTDRDRAEDELGDMLFTVVNIARALKLDSESALKRANRKFRTRFQMMESELARQSKTVAESTPAELNDLWNKVKADGDSRTH
jgi:MazG family protein